eukprot:GHVS01001431.1.p1 GENE.GHVS01001431.1~~GHVS01001431.1.p1  ORF type:complete len:193 (+),score=50.71 GHVS01001431.1:206-784(+)
MPLIILCLFRFGVAESFLKSAYVALNGLLTLAFHPDDLSSRLPSLIDVDTYLEGRGVGTDTDGRSVAPQPRHNNNTHHASIGVGPSRALIGLGGGCCGGSRLGDDWGNTSAAAIGAFRACGGRSAIDISIGGLDGPIKKRTEMFGLLLPGVEEGPYATDAAIITQQQNAIQPQHHRSSSSSSAYNTDNNNNR